MCGLSYSVPAHLIDAIVRAEVNEAEIVVRHGGEEVLRCPRLTRDRACIDCRHVIESLRRKSSSVANYLYREALFPRLVFRQAYDAFARADTSRALRDYVEPPAYDKLMEPEEVG